MSHISERRASPRCDAVNNQSRLEFALPDGRQTIEARLVNISRDGALVVAAGPAHPNSRIWLRIESPVKTDWVEANFVRLGQDREIAIHFPRRCPDDLLLAGTLGIDLTSILVDPHHVGSNCN